MPMPVEKISSPQNPRVKQLVKLRDRRPRDEAGVFLVEGYREIRRAMEKGAKLSELYYSPPWFLGVNEPELISRAAEAGAELVELSKEAFAKAAYRERPDGLLAVAPQWKTTLAKLGDSLPTDGAAPAFLLVVEAIEKPGNLGTILRSVDAAGCHGIIVCDPVTDLFNPNVVRASTGVLFSRAKDSDRGDDTRCAADLHRCRPARTAGRCDGQRAIRAQRILAKECRS
jgi:RNA methyltransferase, TrmH family